MRQTVTGGYLQRPAASIAKGKPLEFAEKGRKSPVQNKTSGAAASPEMFVRELFGRRRRRLCFLFLDQRRALADAFAEVGELGAADVALPLDFHLVHARRVQRENTLHAFAVADAA